MTPEEARIIAWTILGEAAGEGQRGMEAVAHVIRNRAESGRFPGNPASVAIQSNGRGVYQFSAWNPLGNGGNAPRARYPVGSQEMNNALAVVARVFGDNRPNDPTGGATHYYSPSGMPGGAEPYWWRSEAPQGGLKIGRHVFAIKHQPERTVTMPTPRPEDLYVPVIQRDSRMTKQVPLPALPPSTSSRGGFPTPLPADMAAARTNNRATVYDPITGQVRPRITSSESSNSPPPVEREPARTRQVVAGFSVPGGTTGVSQADRRRELERNQSYARQDAAPPKPRNVQTTYGPTSPAKLQDRLTPTPGPAYPGGPRSRDSIAQIAAGQATAAAMAAGKLPPPTPAPPPVQLPPVKVPTPQPTLRVTVTRDRTSESISTPPVEMVTTQTGKRVPAGMEYRGSDGYDYRVERDGTITNTTSGSNSGTRYNPDTNQFESW